MRSWLAVLSPLLALPLGASEADIRLVLGDRPEMRAMPVALKPGDPSLRRVGKLAYLGGVRLVSRDPAFGGFSAMHVAGDRFTLLSDSGNIVRFRMGPDFVPRDARFADLPGGPGTGWLKPERDSEAMTIDPAGGKAWVAFENGSAVYRYDAALARTERGLVPPAMRKWGDNMGPESMVRLRDGRFVILCEGPSSLRWARPGLVFAGDPTEHPKPVLRFGYRQPAGYRPTDAAELPDGRLLVLSRRLDFPPDLFSAKLEILDFRGIKPGANVRGTPVATLARPLLHDNFEALAVTQERGQTIVWIASDDNGQFWEQSLMLKFRLDP